MLLSLPSKSTRQIGEPTGYIVRDAPDRQRGSTSGLTRYVIGQSHRTSSRIPTLGQEEVAAEAAVGITMMAESPTVEAWVIEVPLMRLEEHLMRLEEGLHLAKDCDSSGAV